MLRFLLWRTLGLLALAVGVASFGWLLAGGIGKLLRRGSGHAARLDIGVAGEILLHLPRAAWNWMPVASLYPLRVASAFIIVACAVLLGARWMARGRRRYVRLRIEGHRTDQASAESLAHMYGALHRHLLRRWWRRLLLGQPAVALEVHHTGSDTTTSHASNNAWLALSCPSHLVRVMEAALRTAYPNCRLGPLASPVSDGSVLLRLKKDTSFIRRVKSLDRFDHEPEPAMNRMLTLMGACRAPAFVQLSLTPAPVWLERLARRRFKLREERLSRERREHLVVHDRSLIEDAELRGGLELQHGPLFIVEIRVVGADRLVCEQIASELRVGTAENRLVERGTAVRHGLIRLYARRVQRGEGNPLPGLLRGVFAPSELAPLWHMPSIDYLSVPFAREAPPLAPASPRIMRPRQGEGMLRDAFGPVCIDPELRKQNTAVPGAVEQGKTSYLVASLAEDLCRERCALILLDPKGDAADAALSLVAPERTCTLLDFAVPTCGFNPLAVDAPADVIADYVVGALKNLYSEVEIRASSDRYLRNAIIAVLAHDRAASLWDAARLLSVGEDGYAYRQAVAAHVRTLPELSEIATFFTSELTAQLADARSMTTAKLDAPVNKLARLLNSASIKRVLLNESLRVDFDRVIAGEEVLVVKGALGLMGAGNTSVLMQLLIGMLDAALARQQDLLEERERVTVALKVDEAPLVLNRGFAETMALKRSAGLETVACWQTNAQWVDREVRDQLDALFAHRVYFATASSRDARDAIGLTMAEFTDTVRPGMGHLSKLARPDARLYLPKHHAIASWVTREGRQPPFIGRTTPLRIDRERLAFHAARQRRRGGRPRTDLRQPHWRHRGEGPSTKQDATKALKASPLRADEIASPEPQLAQATGESLRADLPSTERDGRALRGLAEDAPSLPQVPVASYAELVELDRAQIVRWARSARGSAPPKCDELDLQMLALITRLGHVLSSQLHRRFNGGRVVTTTQRRLKRLSDAGLVERFQFYRRDGGGVPMCYVVSKRGMELLSAGGRHDESARRGLEERWNQGGGEHRSRQDDGGRLRQARQDVHVAGWVLALMALAEDPGSAVRGRAESVISPPRTGAGSASLGPPGLRLPDGRVPHDFLRPSGVDRRVEIERFETVRPDATIELPRLALDLMIERDDRLPVGSDAARLHRYDHFLTGWSVHTHRYGERRQVEPLLVFVCRDRSRARRCAQLADAALLACMAYPGEYPQDWDYLGRSRTLFVSERDIHEGSLQAFAVPRLPPAVRVALDDGNPAAGELTVEARGLLDGVDQAR